MEVFINSKSANDNLDMKIDIVNPIPAIKAIPIICLKLLSCGNEAIPSFTPKYANKKMPNPFPKTKPILIPWLKVELIFAKEFASNIIAVLTNAKIGIIK